MTMQERPDGNYNYIPPESIVIPKESVVKAGEEMLPLCAMCTKSRLTCENSFVREVEIPITANDAPEDEVIGFEKQSDGTFRKCGLGFKFLDGVKAGVYRSEEDIPTPFICEFFNQKPLG